MRVRVRCARQGSLPVAEDYAHRCRARVSACLRTYGTYALKEAAPEAVGAAEDLAVAGSRVDAARR